MIAMELVPGSLNNDQRRRDLARLAEETLDVLVIGGGITGVGCALDAASRGLRVGLVEQRDIASGTSSRSSKLLHGGLRYLESRDFALVREALRERSLHTGQLAPHLVRPVSFLLPLPGRWWHRFYYGAGVLLYDLLAAVRGNPLPRHRHLSRRRARQWAPALSPDRLSGGIVYFDAQIDDARHTLAVARTAAAHGAALVTSARVVAIDKDQGVVTGAEIEDLETGHRFPVRARRIVNATGVWNDDIQSMVGSSGLRVQAAKGVHLVVPADRIASLSGIISKTPTSVLFIIPWGRHWLIGTTDTRWQLPRDHPAATATDIDYLLDQANQVLDRKLTTDDVVGVYAGLRPLLAGQADDTAKLSREHAVLRPNPGFVAIAGGKYTTYRVMARDAIDAAVEDLAPPPTESRTDTISLIGSEQWTSVWKGSAPTLARRWELSTELVERLLGRHGSQTPSVLSLLDEDPRFRLVIDGTVLAAEVIHAVRHEGALHLDDVLARRTHLSIESTDRGVGSAPLVADLMGDELGWDDNRRQREVALWSDRVTAERSANTIADDLEASATRLSVTDSRGFVGS